MMRLWRWLYTIPLRLRTVFRNTNVERELDEELRFHLECRIEQEIAKGLSPAEARYAALRSMDGMEQRREECRDTRRMQFATQILQDVRYGVRMLTKSPQFSVAAIGILALAIGANSALFTLFSNYMMRPLPIRGYDRHFDIKGLDRHANHSGGWTSAELRTFRQNTAREIRGAVY